MNKKRLIISSVISIFLVSVLLLGSTYSIFTSQEIDETANVYKTGNLNVTYKVSSNTVHFTDPTPMTVEEADSVIPYRITVTNSGNVPYEFDVILLDTTSSSDNTIDYQYIMTKVGYLEPKLLSDCTNNIIKENVIVPAGKNVDIDIRIWLDSTLSNAEIGKSFYAKLKIDGLAVYNDDEYIDNSKLSLRYMNSSSANNFRNDSYRTYIKKASFVDYIDTSNASINTDTNEKIMWDMSTAQDESVIAWLEDNGETDESGNKLYDLYIGSKERIYAKSLARFFDMMSSLLSISFSNLDTSLTINMSGMFQQCSSLIELDLCNFDTGNVIYFSSSVSDEGMFRGCSSLRMLDISSFYIGKVVDMYSMFSGCSSLTSLNLSNFNTRNVTNMAYMFNGCSSLISLDLSNFNTNNVTTMQNMFGACSSLISLDLSSFNTSNVTTMQNMFSKCRFLVNLDLSAFDTSSVTDMDAMFRECASLKELDLSNFNTCKVTSMWYMFAMCDSLTKLEISNFDTSNVTTISGMFYYSSKTLQTSFTIMNSNINVSDIFFYSTATAEGASIIVNYIGDDLTTNDVNESTESLVDSIIRTYNNPNIVKGELVA